MLCDKCKIECRNGIDEDGNLVAFCRNPACENYQKVVKIIVPAAGREQ